MYIISSEMINFFIFKQQNQFLSRQASYFWYNLTNISVDCNFLSRPLEFKTKRTLNRISMRRM